MGHPPLRKACRYELDHIDTAHYGVLYVAAHTSLLCIAAVLQKL